MPTRERIEAISDRIGQARILILGDIMVDEYLFGTVSRISPEAPVPVVEVSSDKFLLGGAANVANNIRALGDEPILVGTVGDDKAADTLNALLSERDISCDHIVRDLSRCTTTKTRVIAHNQQIVRTDRENTHELSDSIRKEVLGKVEEAADTIQAVLISDYGKGVITLSLLQEVIGLCLRRGIFVAVDPKETHFHNYTRVSVITPNHHEAGFAYGHRIRNEDDLLMVGHGLLERLQAESILITRGADGMSLFRKDMPPAHIPTFARKVYDVTGAGDTVIATYVSAVCAGANLLEAAVVSNVAAGITVGEVGTYAVTLEQLKKALDHNIYNGNLSKATVG